MTKSTPFGNMLTEAIYNIRLREHKLISTVQNEVGSAIGRNGSTIEYWRKGNIPAKEADLIRLTKVLRKRVSFEKTWFIEFLENADYIKATELCNELFPNALAQRKTIGSWAPSNHISILIGRNAEIKAISEALRDKHSRWMIGIDGMGGIGKTAIAQQVSQICAQSA
ncbi:MAG: hypothetical protein M9930_07390, partial [Anaerolineae bacterium]|nr:hypothetical protein [Anaerolineae bacterium]